LSARTCAQAIYQRNDLIQPGGSNAKSVNRQISGYIEPIISRFFTMSPFLYRCSRYGNPNYPCEIYKPISNRI
jgi:hypothetical protein